MKKLCFILALIITSWNVNAQFTATPNGVALSNGGEYYVVEIHGKTASELYQAVETYIISNFKNPDLVFNGQKDKTINLHGKFTNAFYDKRTFCNYPVCVELNLVMRFKDGKIRFDIPSVEYMGIESLNDEFKFSMPRLLITSTTLYTQKGKVLNQKVIDNFNRFINGLVNKIVTAAAIDVDEW